MKTPEDEAFDELARKQGDWGGGFQAKRRMAADKLQEPERETLKLALEALENKSLLTPNEWKAVYGKAITTIKEALAQPAQEPVAWRWGIKKLNGGYEWRYALHKTQDDSVPLYAAPPQRQWIWLSDADIAEVVDTTCQYTGSYEEFLIKKAERKIRGMNT